MKCLVTGGAGFIGSNLCRTLWNKGEDVICLDNLYCGTLDNISDLIGKERFRFIEADIRNPINLEADRIYHLACPASPPAYQKDAVYTLETSFIGAENVLNLALENNCPVLLTSTSEVYGEPQVHPQPESYRGNVNPIGIRACYDEGKRISETLFFDYHRQKGADIRVVRIFNTYGPAMLKDDGRVISNFINQALAGEPLTIYGDGSQTRSFCYVDDTVSGLIKMMECNGFTGPCNIGNPGEYTVKDIARIIIRKTESSSKIEFRELPKDDPTRRQPDISLAREKLGYEPKVTLEEGLEKTINYYKHF